MIWAYWKICLKTTVNLEKTWRTRDKNNNPREPLIPHPVPLKVWSKVGMDLFHFNKAEYIMCVDYYSKYPEISKLRGTTSKHIITAHKSVFARHGVPYELFSDNGTQLVSATQTVKNLLKKAQESLKDPYIALLEYRNTPLEGVGYSPTQLLMGRRLKTKIRMSRNR